MVADLYFLHERGAKIGLYTFAIGGGSALGGVFAGLVANANPNWRWVFGMNAILTGFAFICTIFFGAETNFKRPVDIDNTEGLPVDQLKEIRNGGKRSWLSSLIVTSWYDR
jgi:MFS family permease